MCLGPAVQPPTESARCHVFILRILIVVQIIVVILNFVAVDYFLTEAIFGIFFLFMLYIIQRRISYQLVMFYIFFSMFFAVIYLAIFLVPVQQGKDLSKFSNFDKFAYAVCVFSFAYYLFCMVYCFYPYREFKAITFNQNPALQHYFQQQQEGMPAASPNDANANPNTDYNLNYGNIPYDQKRKKEEKGNYEVFKGKGVVIG